MPERGWSEAANYGGGPETRGTESFVEKREVINGRRDYC